MTPWRVAALLATCSLLLGVLGACGYGGSGGSGGGGYGGGASATPGASKDHPEPSPTRDYYGY